MPEASRATGRAGSTVAPVLLFFIVLRFRLFTLFVLYSFHNGTAIHRFQSCRNGPQN